MIYNALHVVVKGKMVMQTDLALNARHITDVAVDENDKTLSLVCFFH